MRRGALIAALAALALAAPPALAGTGIVHPSGPDPALRAWPNWPSELSCGKVLFGAAGFGGPTEAQNGVGAPESALRQYIDAGLYVQTPRLYWRLVNLTPTRADFASGLLSIGPFFLSFELIDGAWTAVGQPDRCTARSARGGNPAISWQLARQPKPTARSVAVFLNGGRCSGHRDENGVAEPPAVRRVGRKFVITFWLAPRQVPVPSGTVQPCRSKREGIITVPLPGPIGDRQLWDGGTYPPRRVL